MAPPNRHSANTASQLDDDDRIVQAIVIADSFNERFMPITLDKPRCLLPLVNVPIIEYTLEFLAVSGIQEVILFCRSHADQIKDYVNRSRWNKPASTLSIQVVVSPECCSLGDALRDIDGKSLITGDFVLCSGDVVSNLNISSLLRKHQLRRKADKNVIMTMLLKECDPRHRTREHCEGAIFVLDPASSECLAYLPVDSEERDRRHDVAMEYMERQKAVSVRYDLMDCEIDICAQNVLALFTENFDYMEIRRDFCRGVLTSDLLGHKIVTAIVADGEGYAARVRNSRLYDTISRDIIARWTFPIVPESDLTDDQQPVKVDRGLKYVGEGVLLARSCQIGRNTVLGGGVSVGDGATVTMSVIGKNVQIGANCVIDGAYLWEGVVVEPNCVIRSAIVADRTRIKTGVGVSAGCLITADVVVGPRVTLPVNTRVAKWSDRLEAALESFSLTFDEGVLNAQVFKSKSTVNLGGEADGVVWELCNDVDEEFDGEQDGDLLRLERERAYTVSADYQYPEISNKMATADSDHDDPPPPQPHLHDHDLPTDDDLPHGTTNLTEDQSDSNFGKEAYEMARNSIQSSHSVDNAALELNSLKFACNAGFTDCRRAIVRALLSLTDDHNHASTQTLWTRWSGLLHRFVFSEADQREALDLVRQLNTNPISFQYIVPVLYQHDVLEGDVICEWHRASGEGSLSKFVEWLEADDDGDSDGDSDDDEDLDDEDEREE